MSDPKLRAEFNHISVKTADNLKSVAQSLVEQDLSFLSLPEVDELSEIVGRVLPAGNIPSLIVSGLARLPGRKTPPDVIQRDIDVLFSGINQMLDKAVYSTFFAGPAAVIWGYQNLMRLAGRDTDDAFPDGTWQFYVDYALREDTARHTNETSGFQNTLDKYNLDLTQAQRITALVMSAINILQSYPQLLENEWRERIYTSILIDITADTPLADDAAKVYRQWEKQRPYSRGRDAGSNERYPDYRRRKFDDYLEPIIDALPPHLQAQWLEGIRTAKQHDLPNYLRQMSIHGYLLPEEHHETHIAVSVDKLHIGIILDDYYYLIPITKAHSQQLNNVSDIFAMVTGIVRSGQAHHGQGIQAIARLQRARLPFVFDRLDTPLVNTLNQLRYTPILINCDRISASQPLSELRQAERGVGHHALTIFDTDSTLVFDQSHIYFDGAWGSALAEIITNEAQSWAVYLNQASLSPQTTRVPRALDLRMSDNDRQFIASVASVTAECGAENSEIDLKRLLALRRMFKQRSDLLQLTVNDLLVLFRAIHAVTYEPDKALIDELQSLQGTNAQLAAQRAIDAIQNQKNPTILIPVDASAGQPRDRLHPMSFEVPLIDLNLLNKHQDVLVALYRYEKDGGVRAFDTFQEVQREYLALLAGFGAVLSRAKEIAVQGNSASASTIKLLAHIPPALQRVLDGVPSRFEVLNDLIKGREVFSNVGMVAPTSTLTRFITAKDDNEKKTLAWGVMTDANGKMHVTLRDFRLHVGELKAAGHAELAQAITEAYLVAYVRGFNQYIRDLHRITRASRNTRMMSGDS